MFVTSDEISKIFDQIFERKKITKAVEREKYEESMNIII